MKFSTNILFTVALGAAAPIITGCGGGEPVETLPDEEKKVTENTSVLKIDHKLIVIPSPMQMSTLIKEAGAPFDKELMNSASGASNYSTAYKQAINLGVYGADIGYAMAYDQAQGSGELMSAVTKLAEQLNITSAFGPELMSSLKGAGNKEAMMNLVATAYKSCEEILHNDERGDIAAMIATGAWIESMHCAVELIKRGSAQSVKDRVGDQKTTLENLMKLIGPWYSKEERPEFSSVIDTLYYISKEFEQVYSTYSYVEPTTDAGAKKTVINSTNPVSIKQETLDNITRLIETVRNNIIS